MFFTTNLLTSQKNVIEQKSLRVVVLEFVKESMSTFSEFLEPFSRFLIRKKLFFDDIFKKGADTISVTSSRY